MSVLVFLKESELSPAGGPLGVGYYIYQQVKSRNLGDQILFLTGGGYIFLSWLLFEECRWKTSLYH